ncbi:MAG: OsmC family protein [Deltaproteobacteria bacterium]|nr:OsmC family protein [Deltaproteobacteria bacterium]
MDPKSAPADAAPAPRPSDVVNSFSVRVEQVDGFEFKVKFDKEQFETLSLDEPPPLGRDAAPNAARILAAAIGNCLAASLVFCLQKAKVTTSGVSADVDVEIVRNPQRRLRIGKVNVTLHTKLPADHPALTSCLATFEDFCIVTQSVRGGIDVAVKVQADG